MKLKIVCMILVISVTLATAQESTVTLDTNADIYLQGETVIVFGNVTSILSGTAVVIQILHDGATVDIGQVQVADDGSFFKTFIAGCEDCPNDTWKTPGTYDIRATYGDGNIARTQIEYVTEIPIIENSGNFEVDAGSHGTFDVGYEMVGGDVNGVRVDMDILGLVVDINVVETGTITLELPREYIGAEENGNDIDFIVMIDDKPTDHRSGEGVNTRKITMDTIAGESQIKIIGTYVLPEFSTILLILLVSSCIIVAVRYIPMQKNIFP